MNRGELMSRILKLSKEITTTVMNGHKPNNNDEFKNHRKELADLRCKYFGENSRLCKVERRNLG
jgi:hypothetical protein